MSNPDVVGGTAATEDIFPGFGVSSAATAGYLSPRVAALRIPTSNC